MTNNMEVYLKSFKVLLRFGLLILVAHNAVSAEITTTGNGIEIIPNQESFEGSKGTISLSIKKAEVNEVMEVLAMMKRKNIVLSDKVTGTVSLNLYDVTVDEAIKAVANISGFALEERNNTYFVLPRADLGRYERTQQTQLKSFKVQYSDPEAVEEILKNHLSGYGKITTLTERKLLIVEDLPEFINRIDVILKQIDKRPELILIEAKILEIRLDDNETYGINWNRLFAHRGGDGNFGIRGLTTAPTTGFFFSFIEENINITLDNFKKHNRVRTISTPKLLVLENNEAEVLIGQRLGYRNTTTTNDVTTEVVEFLETGVILKVMPAVDNHGRIILTVEPEVSDGQILNGLPQENTTEVKSKILLESGQSAFIGGLIKNKLTEERNGVPVLGDIPFLNLIFANKKFTDENTEIVVIITPRIVEDTTLAWNYHPTEKAEHSEAVLIPRRDHINLNMDELMASDLHSNMP